MPTLKNIAKEYTAGTTAKALKDINIEFRENEFVSILGSSGCGKTTILNVIRGLDSYTSGDLSVNGKSTKEFSDRDWDTYRNHSVGFISQSHNLIPHQTVLANVELVLILSGVSKYERRERAIAVLEEVGLGDQLYKKPNQMSCGQMQRAAIARALVNDPNILLADEPTGALDSETGVQIMEILTEIAKDKLVIMATNNQELAMRYSSRIIKLFDGHVIGDTNPYHVVVAKPCKQERWKKKTSLSFFPALSLSVNSLMTNKARTFLTFLAESIGITGIALILALSSGGQASIPRVAEGMMETRYILTVLAAISLLVSAIMIGSITYISVLERSKEIGILRTIGASKKDISRLFHVESLIVGFFAGVIGIGVTLLLTIPLNLIIKALTGISGIAALSAAGGIVLVLISMALNFIAGLIPSRIAANKAPAAAPNFN